MQVDGGAVLSSFVVPSTRDGRSTALRRTAIRNTSQVSLLTIREEDDLDMEPDDEDVEEEEIPPLGAEYTNYNPFLDASKAVEFDDPPLVPRCLIETTGQGAGRKPRQASNIQPGLRSFRKVQHRVPSVSPLPRPLQIQAHPLRAAETEVDFTAAFNRGRLPDVSTALTPQRVLSPSSSTSTVRPALPQVGRASYQSIAPPPTLFVQPLAPAALRSPSPYLVSPHGSALNLAPTASRQPMHAFTPSQYPTAPSFYGYGYGSGYGIPGFFQPFQHTKSQEPGPSNSR